MSVVVAPKPRLTAAQRKRRSERKFRPIAIELGWLAFEWNRLHEALAELFADIVCSKDEDHRALAFAAWYSIPSDRMQRNMLRATVEAAYRKSTPKPRLYDEIVWTLEQLNSLAGKRNTALHSPLVFLTDVMLDEVEVSPWDVFGNPHARELSSKKLKDKKLIEEFKWYRDHLSRLATFAQLLHRTIAFPLNTLPDRPQLPPRGQFQSPVKRHRKKYSK